MDTTFGEVIEPSCSANTARDPGFFECNICFELAQDPTLTLCGHLYCWPCLYRWLYFHSFSSECPVCKSLIQEEKLVPIYGRGKTSSDSRSQAERGLVIPSRPSGQRPETAPTPDTNYLHQDELGTGSPFVPMATARLRSLTRFALLGPRPFPLNFGAGGFHDDVAYRTRAPYWLSASVYAGYGHGSYYQFRHTIRVEGAKSFLKICFLLLGLLLFVLKFIL